MNLPSGHARRPLAAIGANRPTPPSGTQAAEPTPWPGDGQVNDGQLGAGPKRSDATAVEPEPGPHWQWWLPVLAFVAVSAAVVGVSVLAHAHLPLLHRHHRQLQRSGWTGAFGWWDGWWYVDIAKRGYLSFRPERQSPVAFFPLYPLMIRALGRSVGDPLVAGFVVSLASGLGAAVGFHRWCVEKFDPMTARIAVLVLLLFPFAFYLMGSVYADALFVATSVGAFLALEHDRPVLAGLAAALATATRPVGVALVLGLWVLALERKGVVGPQRPDHQGWKGLRGRLCAADLGLVLAPGGLIAFCGYLWIRFGRPLAFLDTTGAPGWDQPPGFHTWFKVHWIKAVWNGPWSNGHFGHLAINAAATVLVAAFIPAVVRRLGWGYGLFVTIAVVATAISTKDFVGMGRYCLAAFPCFAVAAEVISARPWLVRTSLVMSALGLLMLAQLHARGTIVS